jgi:uncharacterized protein (DUF58 family)
MSPRRPLLLALGAWWLLALAAAFWPPLFPAWQLLGLVLGGIALADLIRLRQLRTPGVERRVTHTLPLGVWSPVQLTLTNRTGEPLRLDLHDVHPPELASRDLPAALRLAGHERRRLSYRVRPPRRGDLRFSACDLGLISPAGLWAQRRRVPLADAVRVFPNFAEISHYTLLASHDQLSQLGVRRLQRRGTGAEFHQLREYRAGDELRQIDWKATSRLRKPIAREYQDERDQRLLVLLDCGRRMRHEDAGREAGTREVPVSHLDEALNALVLLAYVAVRQGDAVGLLTYGGERRWFAPRKGLDTVNRLLAAVYDLQPGLAAADPLAAARDLMGSERRRALVLVVTNGRAEDQPELHAAVRLLLRRHLVVVADLREASLDRALAVPVQERDGALRLHAVLAYLEERRRHHERLAHLGTHVLDLLPAQLPAALLNQYFAIKRAGAL